jgi:hypothetical protein
MKRPSIGFSQRIQLNWLEWTAQLAISGQAEGKIHTELHDRLKTIISVGGSDQGSNRAKAVNIMLKTWVTVPHELLPFRDEGLQLLQQLPKAEHLPVHWGMISAAYPFFGTVADSVGRLALLQGTIAAVQVQRRVAEQYGERETVARATRRILRCFIDWGVMLDNNEKGIYQAKPSQPVTSDRLAVWLVEAAMITTGVKSTPFRGATQLPVLFPFALTITHVASNGRLELLRQGLDNDVIMRAEAF